MNPKPTPMLFVAAALSALAAVFASSAQARIPEGTGTARTSPNVVDEQRAQRIDAKVCADLDRAIRVAIKECSYAPPRAAKGVRTGTGQQAVAHKFSDGYLELP